MNTEIKVEEKVIEGVLHYRELGTDGDWEPYTQMQLTDKLANDKAFYINIIKKNHASDLMLLEKYMTLSDQVRYFMDCMSENRIPEIDELLKIN